LSLKLILQKATKFQLLGSNYMPTLLKYIDAAEIPRDMGGEYPAVKYPWLTFVPDSGATEQDLIESFLEDFGDIRLLQFISRVCVFMFVGLLQSEYGFEI
jgi:hypothetical protein